MFFYRFSKCLIVLFVSAGIILSSAFAQDTTHKTKKRHQKSYLKKDRPWTLEIPLWIPGFRGEFAYGDIDLEGEDGGDPGDPGDPGDDDGCGVLCRLFSTEAYLKFFLSGRVSYEKKKFMAMADLYTVEIGELVKFNYNNKEIVQVNIRAVLARAYAGYCFLEHTSASQKSRINLYAFAGIRFHGISITSDLNNTINKLDIHPTWTEPIIGLRARLVSKKWMFSAMADMGSFYLNNSFSFLININAGYRINRLLSIKMGWNIWDVDYRRYYIDEELNMRINLAGPSASIAFHF